MILLYNTLQEFFPFLLCLNLNWLQPKFYEFIFEIMIFKSVWSYSSLILTTAKCHIHWFKGAAYAQCSAQSTATLTAVFGPPQWGMWEGSIMSSSCAHFVSLFFSHFFYSCANQPTHSRHTFCPERSPPSSVSTEVQMRLETHPVLYLCKYLIQSDEKS